MNYRLNLFIWTWISLTWIKNHSEKYQWTITWIHHLYELVGSQTSLDKWSSYCTVNRRVIQKRDTCMRLEARQITDSVGVVTSKTTSNDLTFERGWSFPVLLTPLVGNRFYDSCIPSLRLLFFPIVLLTSYHLPVEQALTKIFSTGTAANFCINCLFFLRWVLV